MGLITNIYKKRLLRRFDKDEAIPYYSAADFPCLFCKQDSFQNSVDVSIQYFTYHYEEFYPKKLILFCPGMGPGHTAYLAEIESLCRAGYRVLTLDYTGCGASGGERMPSVNAPVRDAVELLDLLHPQEEIIPIGHSLGGYTALCVAHLRSEVTRAVILSGFVGISDEMMGFAKVRLIANVVKQYEKKLDPQYGTLDNWEYLETTNNKLLWIHSTDDPMVNYKYNAGMVRKKNNPNVRVITVENKKHNPQNTPEALEAMNTWIGEYYRLIREKKLSTLDARKAYFDDKPIGRMTAQDPSVIDEILRFIGA